ncbi:hypothetical protein MKZ38_000415 [Zalerion maritima]|uniref:Uncharacterized protein n=1 Tax=Zalerion maritima TaxID=339359 RepID=A0AAD5WY69_9PEZI|nr:hypothetical protein MKZ38_000415 [Zalerion maritima]
MSVTADLSASYNGTIPPPPHQDDLVGGGGGGGGGVTATPKVQQQYLSLDAEQAADRETGRPAQPRRRRRGEWLRGKARAPLVESERARSSPCGRRSSPPQWWWWISGHALRSRSRSRRRRRRRRADRREER